MDFFHGLWPLVWHFGLGGGIVSLALAVAWFFPLLRKTALEVAAVVSVALGCYAVGVKNGEGHVQARWDAAEQSSVKAADKAWLDAARIVNSGNKSGWLWNSKDRFDRAGK